MEATYTVRVSILKKNHGVVVKLSTAWSGLSGSPDKQLPDHDMPFFLIPFPSPQCLGIVHADLTVM